MLPELDYKSSPEKNLQTWSGVVRLMMFGATASIATLALMAIFLL